MLKILKSFIVISFLILLSLNFLGIFLGDLGDPVGQYIPNKVLATDNLKQGDLSLWNPYIFQGFPSIADPQLAQYYLPDLLLWSIFPKEIAYNLSITLHLAFASMGFFLLVKKLFPEEKILPYASVILTILSPFLLSKMVFLNIFQTLSFLPWLILLIINKDYKKFVLLSVISCLAGHPIALFQVLLTTFCSYIYYSNETISKKIQYIFLSSISILGLSAFFILPVLELQKLSVRSSITFDNFKSGTIQFYHYMQLVSPFHKFDNLHDFYIYIGVIPILIFIYLIFNYKSINPKQRKVLHLSILLITLGGVLSTHLNSDLVSRLLFQIPVIQDIRVPARYFFIVHFGFTLSTLLGLSILTPVKRNIVIILTVLNFLPVPFTFIGKYNFSDIPNQYQPNFTELKTSTPEYYLSSSIYLFPNRNIIPKYHNLIGYNPLILKNYHRVFPIEPVGSFQDSDYFQNLYPSFIENNLSYYMFPSEDTLKNIGLDSKISVVKFLENENWTRVNSQAGADLWKSPNIKPILHSNSTLNNLEITTYKPSFINASFELQEITDDIELKFYQTYYPGWNLHINDKVIPATQLKNNYIQVYNIPKEALKEGQNQITLKFFPKSLSTGLSITAITILILSVYFILTKKNAIQ